jgi:hypothetical protein
MAFVSGIKPYAMNPEEFEQILWYSYEKRLEGILKNRGWMKTSTYMPDTPKIPAELLRSLR